MIILNPEIAKKLQEYNIPIHIGIAYLLSIYHNLILTGESEGNFYITKETVAQINLTKIVERDYQTPGNLIWNIPLYVGDTQTEKAWEWIEDWRKMFGAHRADAIGNKAACYKKMKAFFAKNPEVRVLDIKAATTMYLSSVRDSKYLQQADYFISKAIVDNSGRNHTSRLEMYLEILKNSATNAEPQAQRHLGQVVK